MIAIEGSTGPRQPLINHIVQELSYYHICWCWHPQTIGSLVDLLYNVCRLSRPHLILAQQRNHQVNQIGSVTEAVRDDVDLLSIFAGEKTERKHCAIAWTALEMMFVNFEIWNPKNPLKNSASTREICDDAILMLWFYMSININKSQYHPVSQWFPM